MAAGSNPSMSQYALLIGYLDDPIIQQLAKFLVTQKKPIIWIDQAKIGHHIWVNQHRWWCQNPTWSCSHQEVIGVFNRWMGQMFHRKHWPYYHRIFDLLNHQYHNVLNPMKAVLSHLSKPKQLAELRHYHWHIPPSYYGIDHDTPSRKKCIYKSISSHRSQAAILDESQQKIAWTEPVLFQQQVMGVCIRVHVIGKQVIATEIQSTGMDYRYTANNRFLAHQLPSHIEQDCRLATEQLGLNFSGIDLIYEAKKDRYTLLEINPAPGYVYFEKQMATPKVSYALMNQLFADHGA
jgi:hypothetical protein